MKTRINLLVSIFAFLLLQGSSCGTPEQPLDPLGDFSSVAPETAVQTADEARVRYILVDMQLSGLVDYYRSFPEDAAAAEAVRRWDGGTRVANISQFERKIVGGTWQIVYYGTETPIDGMDVMLSEAAAGEATITAGIAYPSEGDLPIPGDIYLYVSNVSGGSEYSTSWKGEYTGSIIVPAPATYVVFAQVIRNFDPTPMRFLHSTTCADQQQVVVNPGEAVRITLIFCP